MLGNVISCFITNTSKICDYDQVTCCNFGSDPCMCFPLLQNKHITFRQPIQPFSPHHNLFTLIFLISSQIFGTFVSLVFLGQAFTIMLVYVWSRRNPNVRMNFFGLLNFQAPFLPWVLMGFSLLLGNSIIVDLLGTGCNLHPSHWPRIIANQLYCLFNVIKCLCLC